MSAATERAAPAWAIAAADAIDELATSADGLGDAEARRRLERDGPNELATHRPTSPASLVLRQFRSPLIAILLVAAAVTVALRELVDAAVIAAVLVVNAVLGFTQEYRAERSIDALRRLARARAHVLRSGREREVDAAGLVRGDVVLLEPGARVPADCRVLHAVALETDESLLTGESATVAKTAEPVAPATALADRRNMLYTGTTVTRGRGRGLVVATATATELGRIAGSVAAIGTTETPLQRRMSRFARIVAVGILGASALAFAVGAAAGQERHELFLAVVALAVAAIPEGLPIVLTVVLALGLRRMAARRAIVRRLAAVETLGSCTVIGSDKTGTLTENRMTVERVVAGRRHHDVASGITEPADGEPLWWTLAAGALCNDASAVPLEDGGFDAHGDPTEIALVVAAARAGLFKDELEERYVRLAEIPFDPATRRAATFNATPDGEVLALVKGAPEAVLPLCAAEAGAPALDRPAALDEAARLAARGLRVLAIAYRVLPRREDAHALAAEGVVEGLTFAGLQGMLDPPRPGAAEAVARCAGAGIRVVMITGDHATTGVAVARAVGIDTEGGALTGVDVDGLDDAALADAVRRVSVFARVSPEHKLRIVRALQANGETVAVTGDGVNDAPALKAAEIGVAMGRSGTDVAKEAADLVVTDDDLGSIFAAVEEGRIAFDNVRKTTFFLISTGVASILAVLASIAFRFHLPFFPAQLLWLNLVTNGVQDIALAFEPAEKDVSRRPPRPRREGIVSRLLWERTVVAGVVMAVGTLALFLHTLEATDDLGRARTVALTTMVLFQLFHVGNSRSEHRSAFAKSPFSNPFLFLGSGAALALHVGALHLAATQFVLRLEPLDAGTWVRMVAVAATVLVAVELHKLFRRMRPL